MKKLFSLIAILGLLAFFACEKPADEQPADDPETVDPAGPETPDEPQNPEDPDTPYVFSLSPRSVELDETGGAFDVTVEASKDYHLASVPDWIRQVSVENKVHHFEVAANKDRNPRSGVIVFCDEKGTCLPVSVSQEGVDFFGISPKSVELEAKGGTFEVSVDCTTSYHMSSCPEWVSEMSVSEGVHLFSVGANEAFLPRSGVIVFCDELGTCLPLSVTQNARPFYHQSVFLRFTATWCGFCPRMNRTVKLAQELLPGKIQHVAVHGNDSSLQFGSGAALEDQYCVDGYPTGIVDGRWEIVNYGPDTVAPQVVAAVKETERVYGTKTGAALSSTLSGRELTLDVDVYAQVAGPYKLTVLLLEDSIVAKQTDYDEGNHSKYTHDCVARMALTSVTGDAFEMDEALTPKTFHYSVASIPTAYDLSHMRILVYVQAPYGTQEVIRNGSFGDYYIDNCATVAIGQSLELAFEE